MLATIHDDTWNMLNMQHTAPNSNRWDYSNISGDGTEKIKGLAQMVEGNHHLRKDPNLHPLGICDILQCIKQVKNKNLLYLAQDIPYELK